MHEISSDEDARWLLPSEALTRFTPDEDAAQAEAPATEEGGSQPRYGFRVGGHGFLTRPGLTGEVVIEPTVYRIPLAPRWLVGVINQRGNIVPVFDLTSLLIDTPDVAQSSLVSPAAGTAKIVVVLGKGEAAAGLCVDDLPRALVPESHTPAEQVIATLPPVISEHLRPGFRADNVFWLELDYASLFRSLALHTPAAPVSGAGTGPIETMAALAAS